MASPDVSPSELEHCAKGLGVSPLSIYQASWACVLSSILNTADVCFGNVVSGRAAPSDNVDELVAPCFNTLPMRVDLSRAKRGAGLVRLLHERNLAMLEYQFTPLRHIQKQVGLAGASLFDTLLLLQQPARHLDDSIWTLEKEDGDMEVCQEVPKSVSECSEMPNTD